MKELALIQGDVSIAGGRLSVLERRDKLIQQMMKIIITEKNGKYFKNYGSEIGRMIGTAMEPRTSSAFVENEITEALEYYKLIQNRIMTTIDLDDEEVLFEISKVIATQISLTAFDADVSVLDRKGRTDQFAIRSEF